jgi:monovalent cation:H+ antiporter, CPA1 family
VTAFRARGPLCYLWLLVSSAQRFLALLVALCLVAAVLRTLSRRGPVPFAVLLAVAGIGVGALPGVPTAQISPDLILLVFIPGLVFEATLSLDLVQLRRHLLAIGLLATAGVAVTVVLIGVLTHLWLGLSWTSGMLLGAVLAPTDPIAVTSVLRQSRAPATLTTLLEGEALFNDGTGVAVFTALVSSLGTGVSAAHVTGDFLVITLGGAAIGVACGLVGVLLLRTQSEAPTDILVTIGIAYGAYLAADLAHTSGIVSTVAAGLVIASTARRVVLHGRELTDFWYLLAFVLNAILFLLIGTALPTRSLLAVAGMAAAAYAIVVAARAVPAYLLLLVVSPRARAIPWRWRHMIFWSGLRGALSVALALSLTNRSGVDQRVPLIAYGVVVLSLVVQGGPIRLVTARLGLARAA